MPREHIPNCDVHHADTMSERNSCTYVPMYNWVMRRSLCGKWCAGVLDSPSYVFARSCGDLMKNSDEFLVNNANGTCGHGGVEVGSRWRQQRCAIYMCTQCRVVCVCMYRARDKSCAGWNGCGAFGERWRGGRGDLQPSCAHRRNASRARRVMPHTAARVASTHFRMRVCVCVHTETGGRIAALTRQGGTTTVDIYTKRDANISMETHVHITWIVCAFARDESPLGFRRRRRRRRWRRRRGG